ncbi:hypothetical protein J6590_026826 [Homalodisca vitripennis]|nr:hypothetical protein J6590_026826 [Homalodisca vitripennis]
MGRDGTTTFHQGTCKQYKCFGCGKLLKDIQVGQTSHPVSFSPPLHLHPMRKDNGLYLSHVILEGGKGRCFQPLRSKQAGDISTLSPTAFNTKGAPSSPAAVLHSLLYLAPLRLFYCLTTSLHELELTRSIRLSVTARHIRHRHVITYGGHSSPGKTPMVCRFYLLGPQLSCIVSRLTDVEERTPIFRTKQMTFVIIGLIPVSVCGVSSCSSVSSHLESQHPANCFVCLC